MKCPYCDFELNDNKGYLFCIKCGHKIEKCPTCGKILTPKTRYCPIDGTKIPQEIYSELPDIGMAKKENPKENPYNEKQKQSKGSKITLLICFLLVCVFLGIVGLFLVKNTASLKKQLSSWVTFFRDNETDKNAGSRLTDNYILGKNEIQSNISEIMRENDNTENVLFLEESNLSEKLQEVETSSNVSSLTEDSVIDLRENNDTEETDSDIKNEPEVTTEYEEITMDHIKSVIVTSELVEKKITHSKERLIDGDLTKAWVEGVSGQGIGESVRLNFDSIYKISGLSINAGYQKNKDLYTKNSRPKQITVEFSDGSSKTFELEDKYAAQILLLDAPVDSEYIIITIDSVYAGSKYKDTCISELSVF